MDTNIFLNVKNKEKPFYPYSKSVLEAVEVDDNDINAIISIITLTELSVGYYKNNEIIDKDEFISGLYSNNNYKICELGLKISDKAAEIRSKINLKLPDCIIIATAVLEGTNCLLTNDSGFDKAEQLIKVHSSKVFFESYLE